MTDPLAATGTTNPNRQVSVRQWNELLTAVAITPQMFGALGDSDATASTGNDDTLAIQAALDYMDAQGGGILLFPAGYYKVTAYLTLYPSVKILGEGKAATFIVGTHVGGGGAGPDENARNGSLFVSWSPINASTSTFISIEDIHLRLTSASNVGACLYDRGGSQWSARNVAFQGGLYGLILDQSELADIDLCNFGGQLAGGAGVWMVNGADLTAGAAGGFTNRIGIKRCQIDQGATTYGVLDDGGYSHVLEDNNYNGCLNHIRASNVTPLSVRGGEFESAASHCIFIDSTTLGGVSVGGGCVALYGGEFSATSGHSAIFGQNAPGYLSVEGTPFFANGGGTSPITGAAAFVSIVLTSYDNVTGVAMTDGNAQYVNVDLIQGIFAGGSSAAYNLSLFPSASVTPTVNGQMVFEATSNTTAKVKFKGGDGVVRSVSLTLS